MESQRPTQSNRCLALAREPDRKPRNARRSLRYAILLLTLTTLHSVAGSENGNDENPKPAVTKSVWYDTARDEIAERLNQTANWFDRFFGDPRATVSTDASAYLQIIFDGFYSGVPDESEYRVRLRGGVDLPRFENKLRLVINSDAEAAITGEELAGIEPDRFEERDDSGGIGLRYLLQDDSQHHFAIGGGLSGGLSPALNVVGRYVYTWPLSNRTVAHIAPSLYWNSDKGTGVSGLLDYEYTPRPDTLWRTTLYGNYGEQTDGFEWSSQASWFRRWDKKTAVSVLTGLRGRTEPSSVIREGWLGFRYRRNIWRPWLFVEAEPGLSWHREVDYRTEPTFGLRLEVQFYKD